MRVLLLMLISLSVKAQVKTDVIIFKSKLFTHYYTANLRQSLYDSASIRRYIKVDTLYCENAFTKIDSNQATMILFVAPVNLSQTNKRNSIILIPKL